MGNGPKDYYSIDAIGVRIRMCVGFLIVYPEGADTCFTIFPDNRRIELSFSQNVWINVAFIVVLVALFSRWVMYLYAS